MPDFFPADKMVEATFSLTKKEASMKKRYSKLVGSRLREVRRLAGYTVSQLAQLFECSEDHYRRIERGVYTLTIDKLEKLYACAGVDPLFLVTGKRRWIDDPDDLDRSVGERIGIMKQLIGYCNCVTKEE